MQTNTQTNAEISNVPETLQTKDVINLPSGTTHKGLKQLTARKEKAAIRKETNEAKKQAVKDERDERRKLSFHFNQLQKFASNYIALLSKETGKKITVEDVKSLKYSNFLPFLTEREDIANTLNGWTFNRLLSVVARYYRNEEKKQVIASVLSDIE
jgi:hypothetical protein